MPYTERARKQLKKYTQEWKKIARSEEVNQPLEFVEIVCGGFGARLGLLISNTTNISSSRMNELVLISNEDDFEVLAVPQKGSDLDDLQEDVVRLGQADIAGYIMRRGGRKKLEKKEVVSLLKYIVDNLDQHKKCLPGVKIEQIREKEYKISTKEYDPPKPQKVGKDTNVGLIKKSLDWIKEVLVWFLSFFTSKGEKKASSHRQKNKQRYERARKKIKEKGLSYENLCGLSDEKLEQKRENLKKEDSDII